MRWTLVTMLLVSALGLPSCESGGGEAACAPDCAGLVCGLDPLCGASCGTCEEGWSCRADGSSCDDVDECATDNGGCEQTCTNEEGDYACSCVQGWTLNADGQSCDFPLVSISGGTFSMGWELVEAWANSDEQPVREVTLSGFEMARTEVTQAQWETLMGNNPSSFSTCGADCPVEQVNWFEALAFCNTLSDVEGRERCYTLEECTGRAGEDMTCEAVSFVGVACTGYRLPTEAEWEYAARAGGRDMVYPWGETEASCDLAVLLDDAGDGCGEWSPGPVCSRSPSGDTEQGLCDMAGNVYEWVWDWWEPYPSEAESDPTGAESGYRRCMRGGSWSFDAGYARTTNRAGFVPGHLGNDLGFRPVRTSP